MDTILNLVGTVLVEYRGVILILTVMLLFAICAYKPTKRTLSLVIVGELCLSYLLYYSLLSNPFALNVSLGFLYLGVFLAMGLIRFAKYSNLISKIYFGMGVYYFLLALEPLIIQLLFVNAQNIVYYINSLQLIVDSLAKLAILSLVVFGGLNSGTGQPGVYAIRFCDNKHIDNHHCSTANENKKPE